MSDDTTSDIDPRFDPAFQRGFDPATPVREKLPEPASRPAEPVTQAAPAVTVPAAAPAAPAARIQPPAFAPGVAPAVARPVASPVAQLAGAAAAPTSVVVAEADLPPATLDAEEQPALPGSESAAGRNPFLLILGIVAVVLVAVGVWLFMQASAGFNSREVRSQGDYFSLQATIQTAPFISLLGVATAIGVLFVFAAKWRRQR